MTRRHDGKLRSAISILEGMLLTDPGSDEIIERCVSQLMVLLGCQYGFAFQCRDASEDTVPWGLVANLAMQDGLLQKQSTTSTSDHIPVEVQDRLIAGKCFYNNARPFDSNELPLPHVHPEVFNFFCLPVTDAKYIHGVIYLCNRGQPFDETIEARLRPFSAAASCLLRSAQQHQQFQQTTGKCKTDMLEKHLLMEMFDVFFNAVVLLDDENRIVSCNQAASSLFCLPRREVIGESIANFLPKGAPKIEGRMMETSEGRQRIPHKAVWRGYSVHTAEKEKVLVDLSAFEIQSNGETLRGLVLDDISKSMQSAADYHLILQRFELLTNLAPVGILQINRNWECT